MTGFLSLLFKKQPIECGNDAIHAKVEESQRSMRRSMSNLNDTIDELLNKNQQLRDREAHGK